jgi:hypothetical protein
LVQTDNELVEQDVVSLDFLDQDDIEWVVITLQLLLEGEHVDSVWDAFLKTDDELKWTRRSTFSSSR